MMTIPGVGSFSAVAIKARIGEIGKFSDKTKLESYAGLVPRSANSGEYISKHRHIKHGDDVLKVALTTAARGAMRSRSRTSVKKLYSRMISQEGQGTTGCSGCSSEEVSVHSLGHTDEQETICRGG
ncbi:MAG: IS110 family transposase [Nitrososphaerota archaeon]|nr:IS110 family transposase [Nitrososphaerota archaeon]